MLSYGAFMEAAIDVTPGECRLNQRRRNIFEATYGVSEVRESANTCRQYHSVNVTCRFMTLSQNSAISTLKYALIQGVQNY